MLIKGLRYPGTGFLLVAGLWSTLNLFDAGREPGVPDWTPKPQDTAVADNGFFLLVGIGEPEGRTAAERHAAGVNRFRGELARATAYLQQTPGLIGSSATGISVDGLPGPPAPALKASIRSDSFCDWQHGPCLQQLESRRARVEQQLKAHRWLQERYVELHGASAFMMPVQDYAIVVMQPSPFSMLETGSEMLRASAGLAALAGQASGALDMLAADIRFQRRLLRSANTHHQAYAALRALARDLSMLDEMLDHDPTLRPERNSVIADLLQPFTAAERDLQPALDGMFAGSMHMVETMASGKNMEAAIVFSKPFFRHNAFVNREWQRHGELRRLLAQTPGDGVDSAFDQWSAGGMFPASGIWQGIRNPIGTLLGQVMLPTDGGHFLLRHEVDAYLRMLSARVGIVDADAPTPIDGFHSKTVMRTADRQKLSFKPFKDTKWPDHLSSVALLAPLSSR